MKSATLIGAMIATIPFAVMADKKGHCGSHHDDNKEYIIIEKKYKHHGNDRHYDYDDHSYRRNSCDRYSHDDRYRHRRVERVVVYDRFSDDDRIIIREYYSHQPRHNKHWRHHRDYDRYIIVGKPIPRHIECDELPPDLDRRLPPLPENRVRVRIGSTIVIKDRDTGFVLDILFNNLS